MNAVSKANAERIKEIFLQALEQRAPVERENYVATACHGDTELREQVEGTVREKLNVRRYASEYVWPAAGAAALFSLLFGYGTGGFVKRMVR